MTLAEAARRAGVSAATLRDWQRRGLIPHADDEWSAAAVGAARVIARMRERGHSLEELERATAEGRLAFGVLQDLFPLPTGRRSIDEAAADSGLDAALVRRVIAGLGLSSEDPDTVGSDEVELLRYVARALETGFPLVALLQLLRVYGQAMARVADAEVRLFHLYVHEPLIRSGQSGMEAAEHLRTLSPRVLPLASPALDIIHSRYLQHFLEQDVVSHMESDLSGTSIDLGRVRVAIAFADLAGYTRLTEEEGEVTAVDAVERFVDAVQRSLPADARVIKTIGDEVMIIGDDAAALVAWAVDFQSRREQRPHPRIAVHYGAALYRDGDYFGREINIASRIAARSGGGEVLVSRPVIEQVTAEGRHGIVLSPIGEIRLRGFNESTELFLARGAGPHAQHERRRRRG
jgi:adenylate cyclase